MRLGILGGGQLARMLALAGHPLGIETVCLDPNENCSAKNVTTVFHADFAFNEKLHHYFEGVDCITYETENLPLSFVKDMANRYELLPSLEILEITQDRLYEKEFLSRIKIPTATFASINSLEELHIWTRNLKSTAVLKTRKGGYDGKGQVILLPHLNNLSESWQAMATTPLIIEEFIPYEYELSLISVRNRRGDIRFYPLTLNRHREGILRVSEAPYENLMLQRTAEQYAMTILEKLNYIGVMTVEFFCLGNQLLVNEIAPRVHNSGHWTIEGAVTSQFENHLRAILDWPLGSTESIGYTQMINLIGKEPNDKERLLKIPGLHYHTYVKEPSVNRKLGHITINATSSEQLAIKIRNLNFNDCEDYSF